MLNSPVVELIVPCGSVRGHDNSILALCPFFQDLHLSLASLSVIRVLDIPDTK